MCPSGSRSEKPAIRCSISATQVVLPAHRLVNRSSSMASEAHAQSCGAVWSAAARARTSVRNRLTRLAPSACVIGPECDLPRKARHGMRECSLKSWRSPEDPQLGGRRDLPNQIVTQESRLSRTARGRQKQPGSTCGAQGIVTQKHDGESLRELGAAVYWVFIHDYLRRDNII